MIHLGTHESEWQGKKRMKNKVRLSWELPNETHDFGKGVEEPFAVHKSYTLSLSDKAALRADLENWRGRPFTEAELESFDVAKVLGAACMVTIMHEKKGENTYANVTAVAALPKVKGPDGKMCPMPVPEPVNPQVEYSIEDHNEGVFQQLPQFMKDEITTSVEWKAKQTITSGGEPELPEQEWEGESATSDEPF